MFFLSALLESNVELTIMGRSQLAHMRIRYHFIGGEFACNREAIHTVYNQI